MTSSAIRQSFLDFFQEKQHTIVPSSSLLPDSPNLLFTNAGMNQFVPIFLGQTPCPYKPARAADTQKCIRAGGKHNDLEDVGFDTYHHTFFEMLGNWSFGDYFKKEAIAWAWELVVGRWNFPASRLYATVYSPGDGDPASFDREAHEHWSEIFIAAGLDPAYHVVHGNKKDNFWMMGDTGPCGPCSELHVNLLPGPRDLDIRRQIDGRNLVNKGDARCIEIWNLVFIQFNANPDGTFVDLPSRHVDTGMGFERVTSMIQGTKGLTDFSQAGKISNYETDVFRPIFDELEKLTGHTYKSTLPASAQNETEQEKIDVAFRVIADHIRTLSFSIADGIQPSNEGRGYVLRRILRRAVKYGRNLGLKEPFLGKLVAVLAETMGTIFPEIVARAEHIRTTLVREEDGFFRTLEGGILIFNDSVAMIEPFVQTQTQALDLANELRKTWTTYGNEKASQFLNDTAGRVREIQHVVSKFNSADGIVFLGYAGVPLATILGQLSLAAMRQLPLPWLRTPEEGPKLDFNIETALENLVETLKTLPLKKNELSGHAAFRLYDTYGFPLDLTELMARERGLTVDTAVFNFWMEEQRSRARAAQKKSVISIVDVEGKTQFVGFDNSRVETCATWVSSDFVTVVNFFLPEETPFYTEMGGQVGDIGLLTLNEGDEEEECSFPIIRTSKTRDGGILHELQEGCHFNVGERIRLEIDQPRRAKIEAHHSATHLLNWALRKVLGNTITQKGSYVGPDRLRFDFSHGAALTPEELTEVERLVNQKIDADVAASWEERPYAEVKGDPSILQFFGDKYGETVRVVSIGDFSKELCGGTHVRRSGQIGYFKILSEGAIAAGIRRIEAASGTALIAHVREHLPKQEEHYSTLRLRKVDLALLHEFSGEVTPQALWQHWETREAFLRQAAAEVAQHEKDEAKRIEAGFQKRAAEDAPALIAAATTIQEIPFLAHLVPNAPAGYLPVLADALKNRWQGVAVLATVDQGKVALLAAVAPTYAKKIQAGKIIQAIAPLVGGKGGGRPELAQGGGTNPEGVPAALAKAEELVRAL